MRGWQKFGILLAIVMLAGCIPDIPEIPSKITVKPPQVTGIPSQIPDGTTPPASGITTPVIKSLFALIRPFYPSQRNLSLIPSFVINSIPDKTIQVQLKDWRAGYMVFWQEAAVVAMPMPGLNDMVNNERQILKELGNNNATALRKNNPDWWKKPYLNVYVYGDTRLRTEELSPTASVWGGGSFWGWRDDEIFYTHANNIFKLTSHSFRYIGENDFDYMRDQLIKDQGITITGPQDLQLPQVIKIKTDFNYLREQSPIFRKLKSAVARDIDGQDSIASKSFEDNSSRTANIMMNVIAPEYRDYLIEYYKAQVDANADGMFIDDMAPTSTNLCFDDYTINLFNGWLASHVAMEQLQQIGVTDISTFNYRQFLKNKGYTAANFKDIIGNNINANEEWRQIPLMPEFRKFVVNENQKALQIIISDVRVYARQKGRDDFLITGNNAELSTAGAFIYPLLDYISFEFGYLKNNQPLQYQSVIPLAKFNRSLNKPIVNQIVSDNWVTLNQMEKNLRLNILKLGVMESYAAQSAQHYVRYAGNDPRYTSQKSEDIFLALEDRWDLQEIQKAFGFMRTYKQYFTDFTTSVAKVAVLYDENAVIQEHRDFLTGNHHGATFHTAETFYQTGIDFDIINYQQIDPAVYQFLLLGNVSIISDEQVKTLTEVKNKGIKIIAIDTVSDKLNGIVENTISKEKAAELIKSQVPSLNLPARIKSVTCTNGKGDYLIHLFNYNYDLSGFKEAKDIKISPHPNGNYKISYASLENPDLVPLDASNIVIPGLTTYGMLLAQKQ